MFVYHDTLKSNESFIDQICIIYIPEEKNSRVASGYKWGFCQCKNQKYLQIWFLPRFSIMSEKCIIYRP